MISCKSIKTFFYINTFLISLSKVLTIYDYFFISTLARNSILMLFIYIGLLNKQSIVDEPPRPFKITDYVLFCSSTLLQSSTEQIVKVYQQKDTFNFLLKLLLFVVILDLLIYFYKFHKTHHRYKHHVLLNTFPTLIFFYFIRFSLFQTQLIFVYKSFIEISGYSGKIVSGGCFPLCIWLPKLLNIDLYTNEHDKHHSQNKIKRFSL